MFPEVQMRFYKILWPVIWSVLIFSVAMQSFSIFCKVMPSDVHTNGRESSPAALSKSSDAIELPIIMYHALVEKKSQQNKYFIPPEIFEEDLKYLSDNGYTAITMTELIDYVYNDAKLPEKPIILTFDDGYYNNFLYAFPLLKKYNQKAVISIIGIQSDRYSLLKDKNSYYSHLTWSEINEMIISGHVELQNHTYDMHTYDKGRKGCTEKIGESADEYKRVLISDIGLMQQKIIDNTGTVPNTITYPFGFYSDETEAIIKELGFKASLTCSEKLNYITKDPDCLYKLGRFLRPPEKSSSKFFEDVLD